MRVQPSGHADGCRRQIDSLHLDPPVREVTRDMARATAQVAYAPTVAHTRRERVEQVAIARLAIELVEEPRRVLLGDRVVGGGNLLGVEAGYHYRTGTKVAGSTGTPSRRISKCKWLPVERPVVPMAPTDWPTTTGAPRATSMRDRCAYSDSTPFP